MIPGKTNFDEKDFLDFIVERPTLALNERFVVVAKEYSLFGAYEYLKNEIGIENKKKTRPIGRIDIIFRYRHALYVGEIKYQPFSNSDFWDASKVLAYCEYYNWQQETGGGQFAIPAILMPRNKIKLEHRLVARKLKIRLFGIEKLVGAFKIIPDWEIKKKPYIL